MIPSATLLRVQGLAGTALAILLGGIATTTAACDDPTPDPSGPTLDDVEALCFEARDHCEAMAPMLNEDDCLLPESCTEEDAELLHFFTLESPGDCHTYYNEETSDRWAHFYEPQSWVCQ